MTSSDAIIEIRERNCVDCICYPDCENCCITMAIAALEEVEEIHKAERSKK